MRKITKIFRKTLWIIAVICALAAVFKLSESNRIRKTNPYLHEIKLFNIKVSHEQIYQNVKGRIEYYVSFHKKGGNEEDTDIKALYSFDVKVCADLKKQHNDADTIVLPYPYIVADQSDELSYTPLLEKGDGINFNDEYQPVKRALQKMAADYAKRNILQDGADNMKDYFEGLFNMPFAIDESGKEQDTLVDVPGLPIQFNYFESQMDYHYSFEFDEVFNRRSLSVVLGDELICTIGLYKTDDYSYATANAYLQSYFNGGYVSIVNPTDPRGAVCYVGEDKAGIICGRYMYLAEGSAFNNKEKYLPDIIYLLHSIKQSESYCQNYIEWISAYDDCIVSISNEYFSKAENDLKFMNKLQKGKLSSDEKYLWSLVKMLQEVPGGGFICETGDDGYDYLVNMGYVDLALNNGDKLKRDLESVETLLNYVQSNSLKDMIKLYCIRHDIVPEGTKKRYRGDLESIVDKGIMSSSDKKSFIEHIKNVLNTSIKNAYGDCYVNEYLCFPKPIKYPNCEVILDLMNSKGEKVEEASYDSVDSIIDKIRKTVHINDDTPQLIYAYTTIPEKKGLFSSTKDRRDAVVFTRKELVYVEDFNDNRKMLHSNYEDLNITADGVAFASGERVIKEDALIKFLQNIQFAYLTPDEQDDRFKDEIKNYVIEQTNKRVWTTPHEDQPIKLKYY